MLEKVQNFLEREIWLIADEKQGVKRILAKSVQTVFVSIRDYAQDKCSIRAAALTFYSALSLVPILALLFGIAKGFGFEQMLKAEILDSTSQNRDMLVKMFAFAENTLVNAKGGIVAGIGVVLLLYTLLRTIGLVENAFNDIWNVKQPRTILRKFTDYMSLTLIAPILLIFSGSATVFISTNLKAAASQVGVEDVVGPVLNFGLSFVPYLLIWILFLGIYMIMPNRRVEFKSALIAAIVAGSIYQAVEWVYITFQIGVSNYNGIYGSFAALPLFLIWVQTSWTIVLFGAELSYAIQNLDELVRSHKKNVFTSYKKLKYGLLVMKYLLHHMPDKTSAKKVDEIAEGLNLGVHLVGNVLFELENAGLVTSIENDDDTLYLSARDSKEVTVLYVVESLLGEDTDVLPEEHAYVQTWVDQLKKDLKHSEGNVFLRP